MKGMIMTTTSSDDRQNLDQNKLNQMKVEILKVEVDNIKTGEKPYGEMTRTIRTIIVNDANKTF